MPTPTESTPLNTESIVCRSNNHFKTEQEGETIIMSIEAGKFFTFNAIGFEIWDGIAKKIKVADLVSILAERHSASLDSVRSDVLTFLNRLDEAGLLDYA